MFFTHTVSLREKYNIKYSASLLCGLGGWHMVDAQKVSDEWKNV